MEQTTIQEAYTWVQDLPDGAVSVETEGATLVLRASHTLQERFETLLARPEGWHVIPKRDSRV